MGDLIKKIYSTTVGEAETGPEFLETKMIEGLIFEWLRGRVTQHPPILTEPSRCARVLLRFDQLMRHDK